MDRVLNKAKVSLSIKSKFPSGQNSSRVIVCSMSSSPQHLPLLLLLLFFLPTLTHSLCRNFCGNMPVKYPFGIDDGCGAPQFSKMLNCSTDLFFQTPSGTYKVQSIDYDKKTMVIKSLIVGSLLCVQFHFKMFRTTYWELFWRESTAFCENRLQSLVLFSWWQNIQVN